MATLEARRQEQSLNLSEFVGGRNGRSTSQILPSWLSWQWLDLTLPARSAPPARRHSVDERSAGIERTRGTLAGAFADATKHPKVRLEQGEQALRPILVHVTTCVFL